MVAVKNSDGYSGSFIFGSGSFEKTTKYRVYVKRDGAIYQKEFCARSVGIAEDASSSDAYIEEEHLVREKKGYNFFGHYMDKDCSCRDKVVGRVLHVPKGTIVYEFKVE